MLVNERQFSLVWCLAENAHRPARRQKAQAIHGPTATDKGDHLLLFFLISLRERERNIDLLFHLLYLHWLLLCICPDWDQTRYLGVSG